MGAKRRRPPPPPETPTIALSSDPPLQMKERLALKLVRRTHARIEFYGPEEAEAMRREDLQRREWQAKGQQHENRQWALGRAMGAQPGAGVSEKVAMELTGHLTRSVFERYNITTDRDRRDAVAKLAATAPDPQILPLPAPYRAPASASG